MVQNDFTKEIKGAGGGDERHIEKVEETAKLSINSVVGLSTPKTMKIKGKIDQQEVITMIDCGATHNFISTKVVQKLGLPLEETLGYGVLMGKGLAVKGASIYRSVTLTL